MQQDDYSWMRKVGLASSIGLVMVISIFIGYFVGSWLDKKLGTTPWLMMILTLMGIAAGFIEMIKIVQQLSKDE